MRPTRVTRRQAKSRPSHRTPVPGRATDQASGGQFAVRTASSRVLSVNAWLRHLPKLRRSIIPYDSDLADWDGIPSGLNLRHCLS